LTRERNAKLVPILRGGFELDVRLSDARTEVMYDFALGRSGMEARPCILIERENGGLRRPSTIRRSG
jgi:hypothetical protein